MPAPIAILKSRLHSVLPEVETKFDKVCERVVVIRIDCHPLRALGGGVDGVEADGYFAFKVATDCVQRQAAPLAGFLVLGAVVVMPGAFGVRPVGLEGVGAAIHKEVEVIRHQTGGRFEANVPHCLLPEGKWTVRLPYFGREMVRISIARTG
jgi:hypothetical protein